MRKIPYTYCIVRYLHDPAAGELLNIGVVMCAPSISFISARFNHHYERLSKAFAGFDGEHYRGIVAGIENATQKLSGRNSSTLFLMDEEYETVERVIEHVAPDRGLSIQFGPMLAGLAIEPEEDLLRILDQSVISQYPQKDKKGRDDDDVWQVYKQKLSENRIEKYLEPKAFVSDSYEFKFDHAFKNKNWHVLKPVTMDYAQSQTIQDRATRVLGEASALNGNRELGTYYILLGGPSLDSHASAYTKAKNLLNKIPVRKEIIEEDAANDFANYLADYMKRHGVTSED